jgi:hypothetical protein
MVFYLLVCLFETMTWLCRWETLPRI